MANNKEVILKRALFELSRRSYLDYVEQVHYYKYFHMKHTRYITERLQQIAEGEQKYLIVELPPRHSKSQTITESFPSYYLGLNPRNRVIATAYSDGLARKFGRLNRNKLKEFGQDVFGVGLSEDNSNANNWDLDNGVGGMVSTGIGGSITGMGADLLIIDDPIKNNEEAQSQTMRDKVWDEWETTLSTRLHKGASVIVVMTRWHEDDLVGRLLERSPYNWERIRIPAIAEDDDDLLGREIGQPLAPELGYDKEWADLKSKEVGTKTWLALYQQRPTDSEGNIFNRSWWQFYDTLPQYFDEQILSWDLTFKDNKDNDYVVGQVWGRRRANYYLLDQVRDQMDFPNTLAAVRQLSSRYPMARIKLIEDKANGPAVISTLKKEIAGIIPVNPKGGKVSRAQAITPFIESGNVFLPKHKDFTYDLIEESASFPNGKHDDMVDAMSQALSRMATKQSAGISSVNIW
ncbi:putative terminase large subunit [uncultured Caudovirales phage]|uniref:Putative terminase large subunit n=1 Tax=uncultured Caudovirales phage TaxID=2100421 RepID=A0A2H4J7G6_9CAUD|nr:putative terminase large subunit [uncultured Caudovirales phage]